MKTHIRTSFHSAVAGCIKTDFTEADFSKSIVIYEISRSEVENALVGRLVQDLRVGADNRLIHGGPGHCVFSVSGYDDDPRELWQIPEFRSYIKRANKEGIPWLYYASIESRWLQVVALCLVDNAATLTNTTTQRTRMAFDGHGLYNFLHEQIDPFLALCETAGVPPGDAEKRMAEVCASFGMNPAPEGDERA